MAPRRRPTKKGETRMDAALDAMSPYGFSNNLVRRTVYQLLEVYGGNEGWVFIEDSAYSLLIDTLLEKQSKDGLTKADPGYGPNEASPARCSNRALIPCSCTETSDDGPLTNQAVETESATSGTGNQLSIKGLDSALATSENGSEILVKPVDISSEKIEPGNQLSINCVDSVSATNNESEIPVKPVDISSIKIEPDCQPAGNFALGENHGSKSPQPVARLHYKRRRPCHGWISSDDDNEELIEPWSIVK